MQYNFALSLKQYPRTMTRKEYGQINSYLRRVRRLVLKNMDNQFDDICRSTFEEMALRGRSMVRVEYKHGCPNYSVVELHNHTP